MENKQTAVTWLINELIQNRLMALRYDADNTFGEIIEQAKQMEKEQLENARPQIISNCAIKEISDEEIDKIAKEFVLYNESKRNWVVEGMKLYRKHLK